MQDRGVAGSQTSWCRASGLDGGRFPPPGDALTLAVLTQACGYELEYHFASVCHNEDTPVVATLRRVPLFEQHPNGGVIPLVWHHFRLRHGYEDTVESIEDILV